MILSQVPATRTLKTGIARRPPCLFGLLACRHYAPDQTCRLLRASSGPAKCAAQIRRRLVPQLAAGSTLSSSSDQQQQPHGAPILICIPDFFPGVFHSLDATRFPGFQVRNPSLPVPQGWAFTQYTEFWKAEVQAAASSALREQPVYLVGEGFGAMVALVVAAATGVAVQRVVLINPPTAFPSSLLRTLLTLAPTPPPFLPAGLPSLSPWSAQSTTAAAPSQPVPPAPPGPSAAIGTLGQQPATPATSTTTTTTTTTTTSKGRGSSSSSSSIRSSSSSSKDRGSSSDGGGGSSSSSSSWFDISNASSNTSTSGSTSTSTTSSVSTTSSASTTSSVSTRSSMPLPPWPLPPLPFPLLPPPGFPPAAPQLPIASMQAAAGQLQQLLSMPQQERAKYVQLLDEGAAAANQLLGSVSQRTLVLAGGQDALSDWAKEAERLSLTLPLCQARVLPQRGLHMLHQPGFHLQQELQAAGFYTRQLRFTSPAAVAPSWGQAGAVEVPTGWDIAWADRTRGGLDTLVQRLCSPVFISTLPGGQRVQGLGGLPDQGPLVVVGNHQLMAPDTPQLVQRVLKEKGLLLRGLGHPALFLSPDEAGEQLGLIARLQGPTTQVFKAFGAVPVAPAALYRLLRDGEAVLLYPGGEREIYKRRNEKYKLFWPSRAEFVRTAAKFGSTIVPLAAVGVEDFVEVLLESQQLVQAPLLGAVVRGMVGSAPKARAGTTDTLGFEQLFVPPLVTLGALPSRMYFLFQEPIRLEAAWYRDKGRCQEVYDQVKASVEQGIEWLLHRRSQDPYADFPARVLHEQPGLGNSPAQPAPTFKL